MDAATHKLISIQSIKVCLDNTTWQLSELQSRIRQATLEKDNSQLDDYDSCATQVYNEFVSDVLSLFGNTNSVYVATSRVDDNIPQGSIIVNNSVWINVGDEYVFSHTIEEELLQNLQQLF